MQLKIKPEAQSESELLSKILYSVSWSIESVNNKTV